MVGFGNSVEVLLLSRVVVGLCKQTMTLATALLTDITSPEDRPLALGQLRTATTLAWTIGQLAGGHLAEHSQQLPAVVAVCQYVVAAGITWFFLDTGTVCNAAADAPRSSTAGNRAHSSVWVTAEKLMR